MKVVFWGSSDFSMPSLKLININHTISAVITNPDACCGRGMKELCVTPVKKFALENIFSILQPNNLKEESFYNDLSQIEADLFVVVSYGMIIPERLLKIPRFHSINLHASLLPKYRGASPIQAALVNGDSRTGVTVQFMSKEMDKGDILLQKESAIFDHDNYLTLSGRLSEEGSVLLNQVVELIEKGETKALKQNDPDATYTKLIKREDGRISFYKETARQIFNKWRAYYSWPGIFTEFKNSENHSDIGDSSDQGKKIIVHLTEINLAEGKRNAAPGAILRADKQGLVVACRDGAVQIKKLKPAGKKEMDYLSFTNGYKPSEKKFF